GARRPPLVLLENVVGFLTARQGDDFARAAGALADLGYWLDAFIVDATHFTPQSRPRVFVVGMTAEVRPAVAREDEPTLFDEPPTPSVWRPASLLRLQARVELSTGWHKLPLPGPPTRPNTLAEVVDADDGQEWWDATAVERHWAMMPAAHRAKLAAAVESGATLVATVFRRVRNGVQQAEVRFDGTAGCLRTPRGGSARQIVAVVMDGRLRLRWMSPREYARLQGAPDFPLVGPTTGQLFGFADAVCVPAVTWIDRHVLTPLVENLRPPAPRKSTEGLGRGR
ncbi:MAG: DNA cytosine methyltransferase, partial [Planctomycetia bacterium]